MEPAVGSAVSAPGAGADSAKPAGGGGGGSQARFLSPRAEGPARAARRRYHCAVAAVQAGVAAEGGRRVAERLTFRRLPPLQPARALVCTH